MRVKEMAQAFQGEVFALRGDEHAGCGRQGIEREQPERRRAIDDHAFDSVRHGFDGLAQTRLSLLERSKLDLSAGEVDV